MVQELTSHWNLSEEIIGISPEGLRSLLRQVEADLHHSNIYGQVMASLQPASADVGRMQQMIKAIGREAIRLAFRRLMKKANVGAPRNTNHSQITSQKVQPLHNLQVLPPPPPPNASFQADLTQINVESTQDSAPVGSAENSMVSPLATKSVSKPSTSRAIPSPSTVNPKHPKKPSKRLSKKELAVQATLQAQADRLRELGQEIWQTRQGQAISLDYLFLKTQIPIHQIEALEAGHIERLPEDVYVRGFVRRIGNALGLDGLSMANSIPRLNPSEGVLPSWQLPKSEMVGGLQLKPAHLYLGYAALLAGGMVWIAQQSVLKAPGNLVPAEQPSSAVTQPDPKNFSLDSPKTTTSPRTPNTKATQVGKINSAPNSKQVAMPTGIAVPERNL